MEWKMVVMLVVTLVEWRGQMKVAKLAVQSVVQTEGMTVVRKVVQTVVLTVLRKVVQTVGLTAAMMVGLMVPKKVLMMAAK